MNINVKKYNLLIANAGLSSKELAEISGVSKVTLSKIKTGMQVTQSKTLGKIAKALNCKVEDFIED